jgi:hypothetical protein
LSAKRKNVPEALRGAAIAAARMEAENFMVRIG